MVSILSLWLPILLAAVLVFLMSSLLHMFLTYHKNDFRPVADEDGVQAALRPFNIPPGDYVIPYAGGSEAMKSDAFKEKVEKGPVAIFTVMDPSAWMSMGTSLIQWFLYCILVGIFVAYLASRTVTPDLHYLGIFRITGATAFCCYSLALMQRSIWYKQSWATTGRSMFDGFLYALLTAGAFAGFWPG